MYISYIMFDISTIFNIPCFNLNTTCCVYYVYFEWCCSCNPALQFCNCLVDTKHYSFGKRLNLYICNNQVIHTILYHALYHCIMIQWGDISMHSRCVSLHLYLLYTYKFFEGCCFWGFCIQLSIHWNFYPWNFVGKSLVCISWRAGYTQGQWKAVQLLWFWLDQCFSR